MKYAQSTNNDNKTEFMAVWLKFQILSRLYINWDI